MSKAHTMLLRCQTIGKGGERRILNAAKHNLREIGGEHIASDRSHLNVILAGAHDASAVLREAAERTSTAIADGGERVARKVNRKNGTRAAEILFGLPASTPVETGEYFAACLAWVRSTFGDVVFSAVIHYDESAPHAHVLMLPMRQGEWLGSDVFGKRADIQKMQTDFARVVGRGFGVEQAPERLSGSDREAAVQAVINHLRASADPVLKSATWPVVRDQIHADPRPFAEHLGIRISVTRRTLAQLKVSSGRGAKRENAYREFDARRGFSYPVLGVAPGEGSSARSDVLSTQLVRTENVCERAGHNTAPENGQQQTLEVRQTLVPDSRCLPVASSVATQVARISAARRAPVASDERQDLSQATPTGRLSLQTVHGETAVSNEVSTELKVAERQIAEEHGISHEAENKPAKKARWTRDLADKVAARAEEKVSKAVVSIEASAESTTENHVAEATSSGQHELAACGQSTCPAAAGSLEAPLPAVLRLLAGSSHGGRRRPHPALPALQQPRIPQRVAT